MLYQFCVLAQAADGAGTATPQNFWTAIAGLWFIPVLILIFWFLVISPQRKKDKQRDEMRKSIKKNDKVVTIGGIHGIVKSLTDDDVVILVDEAKDVKIRLSRQSILNVEERSGEESAK